MKKNNYATFTCRNTIHDKVTLISIKLAAWSRGPCKLHRTNICKFANKSHIAYKCTGHCLLGAYLGFSGPSVNDRSS